MRWLLVLVTGCFSPAPPAGAPCGEPPTCPRNQTCIGGFCLEPGSTTDAMTDGPADMAVTPPDACTNFATQLDTCTVTPGAALVLAGSYDYDTDSQTLVQAGVVIPTTSTVINGMAGPVIAIVTESFTLTSGQLRVVGEAPFGIVAFGDISIGGLIDASAGGAGRRGNALCMDNVGRAGTTANNGSSGAGGGGFQGAGGKGGEGDENQSPGPLVSSGDGGPATTLPAGPLGGCRGGTGGGGTGIQGEPGQGGGAIYLVSAKRIDITGSINAGGGGGFRARATDGGGGGGGSGGMIVLEAPVVDVSGVLAANGGGGSGGADDLAGNDGQDGETGRLDTQRASGGSGFGAKEGGDGGAGGAGVTLNGDASIEEADNGGGGGGGGCGFIAIGSPSVTTVGAVITPARSVWPSPPN